MFAKYTYYSDNQEDDQHFPTLTVAQTLRFAIKNKIPSKRPGKETRGNFVDHVTDVLLKMFGIAHTANTAVGDAMIRGVSGGERKRVSSEASSCCQSGSTKIGSQSPKL